VTGPGRRDGTGVLAAAEYVYLLSPWFSPRAYAGFLATFPDGSSCGGGSPCDVSAKIGFTGVKVRFAIPIPYVAPFLELGVGASLGAISTQTPESSHDSPGIAYHIPTAIGLALGEKHNIEFAFSYLFHPEQEQVMGGLVVSLSFPLPSIPAASLATTTGGPGT
jgi:hypothetical protein